MNNQVTTKVKNVLNGFTDHEIGEDHLFTGLETPMKKDAFKLTDEEKKSKISNLKNLKSKPKQFFAQKR